MKVITLKELPNTLNLVLGAPLRNSRQFLNELSILIDKDVRQTFKTEGNIQGRAKWKAFSQRTLHPSWMTSQGLKINYNKWNRRRGTDNAKTIKYSDSSKLLQSSGGFMKMMTLPFAKLSLTNIKLKYGSRNKKLAKQIMSSGGGRNVLGFGNREYKLWRQLYITWSKLQMKK